MKSKWEKLTEIVESFDNGNISDFKAWVKRASKLDILTLIEVYSSLHGNRVIIINTMRSYLE
jgi:hypothetical protein